MLIWFLVSTVLMIGASPNTTFKASLTSSVFTAFLNLTV